MSKKKNVSHQEQDAQHAIKTPTRVRAQWELERADTPTRALASQRTCRTCKRPYLEHERTPADAVLDIAAEPLIAYAQLHAGEATNWALREKVLDWLDRTHTNGTANLNRLEEALNRLAHDYPLLGALLAATLQDTSERAMADELGVSNHTVAVMQTRLHNVLAELLR